MQKFTLSDIHIEVPRLDYEKLSGDRLGESSEAICRRMQVTRDIQLSRFQMEAQMLFVTPICVSGRYSSFAGCGMRVRV